MATPAAGTTGLDELSQRFDDEAAAVERASDRRTWDELRLR